MKRIMERYIRIGRICSVLVASFCIPSAVRADDASTAWQKVLKKCAKTDVIGRQSLFFGVSNTIGPGSVWRFADDKSIRLMFELSDAFPKDSDRAPLVKNNNVATCTGDSSSSWNLKLGLPFSTGVSPISIDISAALGGAKKVTVSVTGFAVDELKETPWKEAFKTLGASSAYVQEVAQPNRLIAENTVKVTGLKATFVFGIKLSADVQAKFKGKTFTLGAADGTSAAAPASGAAGAVSGASPSTGASGSAGAGTPTTTGAASSGTSSGAGAATLHADVTNDNTITLTADGPFYLIGAYSKLVGSVPVGLDQGTAPIVLAPANIPSGLTVKSDRKKP